MSLQHGGRTLSSLKVKHMTEISSIVGGSLAQHLASPPIRRLPANRDRRHDGDGVLGESDGDEVLVIPELGGGRALLGQGEEPHLGGNGAGRRRRNRRRNRSIMSSSRRSRRSRRSSRRSRRSSRRSRKSSRRSRRSRRSSRRSRRRSRRNRRSTRRSRRSSRRSCKSYRAATELALPK